MTSLSHPSPNRTEACGRAEVSGRGGGGGWEGVVTPARPLIPAQWRSVKGELESKNSPDSAGWPRRWAWRLAGLSLPLPCLDFVNGCGWSHPYHHSHGVRLVILTLKYTSVRPKSYMHVRECDVTSTSL